MVVVMVVVREGRSVPVYGRGGVLELRTGGRASGSKTEEGGSGRKRGKNEIFNTYNANEHDILQYTEKTVILLKHSFISKINYTILCMCVCVCLCEFIYIYIYILILYI